MFRNNIHEVTPENPEEKKLEQVKLNVSDDEKPRFEMTGKDLIDSMKGSKKFTDEDIKTVTAAIEKNQKVGQHLTPEEKEKLKNISDKYKEDFLDREANAISNLYNPDRQAVEDKYGEHYNGGEAKEKTAPPDSPNHRTEHIERDRNELTPAPNKMPGRSERENNDLESAPDKMPERTGKDRSDVRAAQGDKEAEGKKPSEKEINQPEHKSSDVKQEPDTKETEKKEAPDQEKKALIPDDEKKTDKDFDKIAKKQNQIDSAKDVESEKAKEYNDKYIKNQSETEGNLNQSVEETKDKIEKPDKNDSADKEKLDEHKEEPERKEPEKAIDKEKVDVELDKKTEILKNHGDKEGNLESYFKTLEWVKNEKHIIAREATKEFNKETDHGYDSKTRYDLFLKEQTEKRAEELGVPVEKYDAFLKIADHESEKSFSAGEAKKERTADLDEIPDKSYEIVSHEFRDLEPLLTEAKDVINKNREMLSGEADYKYNILEKKLNKEFDEDNVKKSGSPDMLGERTIAEKYSKVDEKERIAQTESYLDQLYGYKARYNIWAEDAKSSDPEKSELYSNLAELTDQAINELLEQNKGLHILAGETDQIEKAGVREKLMKGEASEEEIDNLLNEGIEAIENLSQKLEAAPLTAESDADLLAEVAQTHSDLSRNMDILIPYLETAVIEKSAQVDKAVSEYNLDAVAQLEKEKQDLLEKLGKAHNIQDVLYLSLSKSQYDVSVSRTEEGYININLNYDNSRQNPNDATKDRLVDVRQTTKTLTIDPFNKKIMKYSYANENRAGSFTGEWGGPFGIKQSLDASLIKLSQALDFEYTAKKGAKAEASAKTALGEVSYRVYKELRDTNKELDLFRIHFPLLSTNLSAGINRHGIVTTDLSSTFSALSFYILNDMFKISRNVEGFRGKVKDSASIGGFKFAEREPGDKTITSTPAKLFADALKNPDRSKVKEAVGSVWDMITAGDDVKKQRTDTLKDLINYKLNEFRTIMVNTSDTNEAKYSMSVESLIQTLSERGIKERGRAAVLSAVESAVDPDYSLSKSDKKAVKAVLTLMEKRLTDKKLMKNEELKNTLRQAYNAVANLCNPGKPALEDAAGEHYTV